MQDKGSISVLTKVLVLGRYDRSATVVEIILGVTDAVLHRSRVLSMSSMEAQNATAGKQSTDPAREGMWTLVS